VPEIHLIESDRRKAIFLAEAIRITRAPATIHAARADRVAPFIADVVTARACAPLPDLLGLALPFIGPDTVCLFLKGRAVAAELTEAAKRWNMRVETLPSVADRSGCVLKLEGVARVEH
jgi:16S rRNA (guanine527-N7)-methyltransferase